MSKWIALPPTDGWLVTPKMFEADVSIRKATLTAYRPISTGSTIHEYLYLYPDGERARFLRELKPTRMAALETYLAECRREASAANDRLNAAEALFRTLSTEN